MIIKKFAIIPAYENNLFPHSDTIGAISINAIINSNISELCPNFFVEVLYLAFRVL